MAGTRAGRRGDTRVRTLGEPGGRRETEVSVWRIAVGCTGSLSSSLSNTVIGGEGGGRDSLRVVSTPVPSIAESFACFAINGDKAVASCFARLRSQEKARELFCRPQGEWRTFARQLRVEAE